MEYDARFGSASLSQLADLLGESEEQVLADAISRVGDGAAVRGWLRPDAVSAVLSDFTPSKPLQDAEPLIIKAFRQAKESDKAEWTSMAIPVFKNRMLQLSSKGFREADFGSPNIWHFVTLFPDLIATEGVRPRERIRMMDPSRIQPDEREQPAALDPVGLGRIRQDLWRALFDYSSNVVFVWDEAAGRARVRTDSDSDSLPIVPTISAADMDNLRAEFVSLQEKVSDYDAGRLDEWAARGGPTVALPRFFRGLWNAHLKSHAANTLRAFFLSENLDVPHDLIARATASVEPEREVERVRRLAHRYVDAMTADELSRLSFEIAVVLRVQLHGEGRLV